MYVDKLHYEQFVKKKKEKSTAIFTFKININNIVLKQN